MKKQTLSGAVTIASSPMGEEKIIPASRRPDGSIRKERKIRPGFVAQEDVSRFVAAPVAAAKKMELPVGSVIGRDPLETVEKSKNQKRNEKRKAKKFLEAVLGQDKIEPVESVESIEKKIRNLKKKLGQINEIQLKLDQGLTVEEAQLDKLDKRSTVESNISQLEKQLENMQITAN